MKAKEIELLIEKYLDEYAGNKSGKEEFIMNLNEIPFPEDYDADSMLNIELYMKLVTQIMEGNLSLQYVKCTLQDYRKIILSDKMFDELKKYNMISNVKKVNIDDKITFKL